MSFYITTEGSGTSFQILIWAVAGTNAASADLTITYDKVAATYSSFTGPTAWSSEANSNPIPNPYPTLGTVIISMAVGTSSNAVGTASDGLLGTLTLILTSSTSHVSGTVFVDDYADFALNSGPAVSPLAYAVTACFGAGTRIQTTRGEIAVEDLYPGDTVVTKVAADRATVKWIGYRDLASGRHPQPQDVLPVRIAAGAFAHGAPRRDLRLSPDHAVFVDGALIPIRYLLNDATIVQEPVETVTYWHVELDRHDVLFAEGLPCESYLDTGNRGTFSNGGGTVVIHPEFALRVWEREGCAPLVTTGSKLVAARSLLRERARVLGHSTTQEAALHLVVDGDIVWPRMSGCYHYFDIPGNASTLRLVSRRMVPARLAADGTDHRQLGVAVARILADGVPVPVTDARLVSGWHEVEHDGAQSWRWTDGDAVLVLDGPRVLEFELALTAQYPCVAASEAA